MSYQHYGYNGGSYCDNLAQPAVGPGSWVTVRAPGPTHLLPARWPSPGSKAAAWVEIGCLGLWLRLGCPIESYDLLVQQMKQESIVRRNNETTCDTWIWSWCLPPRIWPAYTACIDIKIKGLGFTRHLFFFRFCLCKDSQSLYLHVMSRSTKHVLSPFGAVPLKRILIGIQALFIHGEESLGFSRVDTPK